MSLFHVSEEILQAQQDAGRASGSVELIAVSKVQPNDRVLAVLQQGHRVFGENRVQEAEGKWPEFQKTFPDAKVHLLGPLQSNKARAAMRLFDCLHTLDRPKLATALARLAQELGHCPALFIQVNTGLEPQKAGIAPDAVDTFVKDCRALDLPVMGLMCIPPVEEEASLHFRQRLPCSGSARDGLNVHPTCRGRGQPAFCAFGQTGAAQWARGIIHGHVR